MFYILNHAFYHVEFALYTMEYLNKGSKSYNPLKLYSHSYSWDGV